MNIKEIKELVKMLDGTDISELTLESEGDRVIIKKGLSHLAPFIPPVNTTLPFHSTTLAIPTQPAPTSVSAENSEKSDGIGPNQILITAPMVGTFYRAPSPDAEPYAQSGQVVEVGQVICIIEAMKLMNEIESEQRGKIVQIMVENAQPVEYGQPLFLLEKI